MGQETVQPATRKSRRRIVLAAVLVLVVVGAVAGVLFEATSNTQISIRDPPQQSYDPTVQAIYVTFTSIEVHVANAHSDSGWTTIATSATVNLFTVLNVSKVLGKAQVPAGKYTELRFNVSKVVVTISGVDFTYTIPSGSLKVPITGGGFQAYGALTVNVELDLSFRTTEILNNPTLMLNPVATARVA
jgi:predicted metal-binding membrane protein